ncbi:hypothetical protein FACS1894125_1620 [Actinomycetota bacterium]|nr:hypothetical protein FACS1894125_1620 [Actinomycetota bacterium]
MKNNMAYFVVMCIGWYAVSKSLGYSDSFRLLSKTGALNFLISNYEAEHLLGPDDVIEDLQVFVDRGLVDV